MTVNAATHCPACGSNWQGEEIPAEIREHYGGHTHWQRQIAIYDRGKDCTVAYRCPDCGKEFPA